MIKANELRIGNWVLIKGTITHKLITAYDIISIIEYTSEFSPIPLTPEVLEKCGFKLIAYKRSGDFYELNGLRFFPKHSYFDYKGASIYNPYYLHQLQNLYFALTGEELEYKP